MGRGIGPKLALVVPLPDHLAVVDDHRADRHIIVVKCARGLPQGQTHEVLIARKELPAHGLRATTFEHGNFRRADGVNSEAVASEAGGTIHQRRAATHTGILRIKRTIFQLAVPLAVAIATVAIVASTGTAAAHSRHGALSAPYVSGEVVVGYAPTASGAVARAASMIDGLRSTGPVESGAQVLRLPADQSVQRAVARLLHTPGVAYAVPNYLAHTAGDQFVPNDPGRSGHAEGWETMQWNFLAGSGVDAPGAWANLRADGHPGGQGVVVAIVDTGVAYRNWHEFRRSPDFTRARFTDPYDFLAHNRFPLDRNGHGTFIAGTVAESTNNGQGLTGLAYGARSCPSGC